MRERARGSARSSARNSGTLPARARGQVLVPTRGASSASQSDSRPARACAHQPLHRDVADAARRHVDDAQERDLVRRVGDHLEVGDARPSPRAGRRTRCRPPPRSRCPSRAAPPRPGGTGRWCGRAPRCRPAGTPARDVACSISCATKRASSSSLGQRPPAGSARRPARSVHIRLALRSGFCAMTALAASSTAWHGAVVLLEPDLLAAGEVPARSRGCSAPRRRASCRCTGRRRPPRRRCCRSPASSVSSSSCASLVSWNSSTSR